MSKRLSVVLPDVDMDEIRRLAEAIRKAARFSFPTADVEQMLEEIERGS